MATREEVVTINNFGNGMAEDYSSGSLGEASLIKHFDTLSFPKRLQPLRGMATETTSNSLIGNIIVSQTGNLFGVGTDPSNPTLGELWYRNGFSTSPSWTVIPSTTQLSGTVVRAGSVSTGVPGDYAFLTEYPDAGNTRTMYWASTNLLVASDPAGGSSAATQALTFTTISQGFVHPSDKVLYFGYQTATATFIGSISSDATVFNTHNFTAFTKIPSRYRVSFLTNYGDYLAIGLTSSVGVGSNTSLVILWDRDTSLNTISQIIPWGTGDLEVGNNLNGAIIGVSSIAPGSSKTAMQDNDGLQIKVYNGGVEPVLIKDIPALRLITSAGAGTQPTVVINPNVNFVFRNRLYFSANVLNGSLGPAYYGLWSVGKTRDGHWNVSIERMATNGGTETGVIAAAITGDFVSMCHTALGTLTYSENGNSATAIYDASSTYESCINPQMAQADCEKQKKLMTVFLTYLPLQNTSAGAQIVMKYRVDSQANGAWTTILTAITDQKTQSEQTKTVNAHFTDGYKYEFQLISTDGAIITGFGYKYMIVSNTY